MNTEEQRKKNYGYTNAEMIYHATIMYGVGSPQHKEAMEIFADE